MGFINNYLYNTKYQLIILITIAFSLNINTVFNDYAVDDSIVLTNNNFVKKGISGIPEILSEGYFNGYATIDVEDFSGGRYRPLTLVIFAIEYQFFGANPFVSHSINVFLFVVLVILLFKFLQTYIIKEKYSLLAFGTCLIFTVHPIHTEVIANVKGRDELVAFVLLLMSLNLILKYITEKKSGLFIVGLLVFFLALLAKETVVTYVIIIPLILYYFYSYSIKKSISYSIPLVLIVLCYIILRFLIVGTHSSELTNIINAPFYLATPSEAFATKVFILYKYLCLLIYPFPLSWEYGYNQIPYIEPNSIQFILSALLIVLLIAYAFYTFKRKSLLSFSIFYFFINIGLVANFIVDIGTPLSERFLFQPSLAICIVLAFLLLKLSEKYKLIAISTLSILIVLFSTKTLLRNLEWKNEATLFIADVNASPNSLRANGAAMNAYMSKAYDETDIELKKSFYKKAVFHTERLLEIYPIDQKPVEDLLTAYCGLFDCYQSLKDFLTDNNFDPSSSVTINLMDALSQAFYKKGNLFYDQDNIQEAISAFQKSTLLNKNNTEAWYNLGGCYYIMKDTIKANSVWENVKTLDPDYHIDRTEFIAN